MLTPRIALTHQTGFMNWRRHSDGLLRFDFEPGADTSYSGEGFAYLVNFVERKLGRSFEALAHELVLEPAGMADTELTLTAEIEPHLAWRFYPGEVWREPRWVTETNGADQMRTTSADYARFMMFALRQPGIPENFIEQQRSISRDLNARNCLEREARPAACPDRLGHALSWYVYEYPDETIIMHSGANTGLRAVALYVPERDWGMTAFANGENGNYVIYDLIEQFYDNPDFIEIARPSRPFSE